MSLKIGDRVKSYDFVMGNTLLNDKAYVVGDIIDIAPVDWCGDNCDHYHIKILERFDAYGESIEGPEDWMVFPPVYDSMVVLSNWPNDELESETIYDYVTSQDSTCSWCGETPKFMVYDLPTGPHAFCSEKHYARFVGMDEKPPGWYGYEAESNQMFRREATLFGIGVVSAVIGTFLAEMLIDRYREDPELLDTPAPEQNA
jgi:hypothetical protein